MAKLNYADYQAKRTALVDLWRKGATIPTDEALALQQDFVDSLANIPEFDQQIEHYFLRGILQEAGCSKALLTESRRGIASVTLPLNEVQRIYDEMYPDTVKAREQRDREEINEACALEQRSQEKKIEALKEEARSANSKTDTLSPDHIRNQACKNTLITAAVVGSTSTTATVLAFYFTNTAFLGQQCPTGVLAAFGVLLLTWAASVIVDASTKKTLARRADRFRVIAAAKKREASTIRKNLDSPVAWV